MAALEDIRAGAHRTYDRVVLEIGPGDEPQFDYEQVDELIANGSGNIEWVTGLTFTAVTIHGAYNEGHYPGPLKFSGPAA